MRMRLLPIAFDVNGRFDAAELGLLFEACRPPPQPRGDLLARRQKDLLADELAGKKTGRPIGERFGLEPMRPSGGKASPLRRARDRRRRSCSAEIGTMAAKSRSVSELCEKRQERALVPLRSIWLMTSTVGRSLPMSASRVTSPGGRSPGVRLLPPRRLGHVRRLTSASLGGLLARCGSACVRAARLRLVIPGVSSSRISALPR